MSTALDAVRRVLTEAGEPLQYKEITRRALDNGYWEPTRKNTQATSVSAKTISTAACRPSGSRHSRLGHCVTRSAERYSA